MRVYVAGPLFTPDARDRLQRLADAVRAAGHSPVLPFGADEAWPPGGDGAARRAAFERCVAAVKGVDAVAAVLDGVDVDPGTAFEVGYARARGIPVFGARTDYRTLGAEGPVNLMLAEGVSTLSHHAGGWDAVVKDLEAFLAEPPRLASPRLVRDKDPQRARAQSRPLDVRKVEGEEYVRHLKARLVTVAERIAAAAPEDEKEEVADLLEAVETLIAYRAFDKESLRRVKEKLVGERGGYRLGYVAEP